MGNKKCWFLNRLRIRSVGRFVCDLCRRLSVQHGLQLQLAKEFATSWTSFNIHARLTYAQLRAGGQLREEAWPLPSRWQRCNNKLPGQTTMIYCSSPTPHITYTHLGACAGSERGGQQCSGVGGAMCIAIILFSTQNHIYIYYFSINLVAFSHLCRICRVY